MRQPRAEARGHGAGVGTGFGASFPCRSRAARTGCKGRPVPNEGVVRWLSVCEVVSPEPPQPGMKRMAARMPISQGSGSRMKDLAARTSPSGRDPLPAYPSPGCWPRAGER